jgi:hypothetical protein
MDSNTKQSVTQLARAEALAVVKAHLRAEARAQATLAKRDMAEQANVQFARVEQWHKEYDANLSSMAGALQRNVLLCDVLMDLVVNTHPDFKDLDVKARAAKFEELIRAKLASYEAANQSDAAQPDAEPGKPS